MHKQELDMDLARFDEFNFNELLELLQGNLSILLLCVIKKTVEV